MMQMGKTYRYVSIHASVKDATSQTGRLRQSGNVSIHASVKDATTNLWAYKKAFQFQSTHL